MDHQPAAAAPVCYRHPGRPTRLSCSECGRSICVECSQDAVVGQECPECAAPSERYRVIPARQITRANRSLTPVALGLMVINGIVFLIGMASEDLQREILVRYAHFPPAVADGEWWRLFTAMFLHSNSNLMHILFNMYALWIFGPVLERRFGSLSFISLYLAAGLGGGALFQAVSGADALVFAVGASGAIFGLLGALLAASYRQRHTPAGRAVFTQLALLLAINMALPWERLPRETPHQVWQRVATTSLIGLAAIAAVFFL